MSFKDFSIVENCLNEISRNSSMAHRFWMSADGVDEIAEIDIQDHADTIYSAYLLGIGGQLSSHGAQIYQDMLAQAELYGRPDGKRIGSKSPNAHLTAYLLGAARILERLGKAPMSPGLFDGWRIDQIIDEHAIPRWPKIWTHHSWRVSHWIGGGPSILLQLARSQFCKDVNEELVIRVLHSCADKIIDRQTGLLKPYKSTALHKVFNSVYRLRHDPDIGELGGVVHILWIFHAIGIDYVARDTLGAKAMQQLVRAPFMEKVPYCLDFDIIQLARTAKSDHVPYPDGLIKRSRQLSRDIVKFFSDSIPEGYTLHKLPGALATLHECSLILNDGVVPGIGIEPLDIIVDAYWL
jgi:hypothetical protein